VYPGSALGLCKDGARLDDHAPLRRNASGTCRLKSAISERPFGPDFLRAHVRKNRRPAPAYAICARTMALPAERVVRRMSGIRRIHRKIWISLPCGGTRGERHDAPMRRDAFNELTRIERHLYSITARIECLDLTSEATPSVSPQRTARLSPGAEQNPFWPPALRNV